MGEGRDAQLIAALRDRVANDLLDVDRRPLGEVGSVHWDATPTDMVLCPYADARRGHPMNRSALKQAGKVWPSVLSTARWLAGDAPTVHGAWRVAVTGTSAPAMHLLRCPEAPVPRVLSALYKTSLGFSQVLTALLLTDDGVADAPLSSLGTGADFFDLLDGGRWLVGELQACAGSRAMIEQLLDAIAGRTGEGDPDPALVELGAPASYVEPAATLIGLQVAWLGASYQAGLRGDTGAEVALRSVGAPWLRGVLATPGRRAEHARRLFPAGATPPAVEAFLAEGPAPPAVLDARLERHITALSR